MGIKKDYNPKGLGLLLHAYVLLYRLKADETLVPSIEFLFNRLREHPSAGYHGYCWGYNFGWTGPESDLPAYTPTAVATGFISKGVYEYLQLTGDPRAREMLVSSADFILKDLNRTETGSGICFSYSPPLHDCCYNASLLAAETLARVYALTHREELRELSLKAVDFVVSKQLPDGRWNYKWYRGSDTERKQIDFHQGFVIDSIRDVVRYTGCDDNKYMGAVKNGIAFYRKEQFFADGRSKWRLPIEWPVEIHNQSQGIITLSRHADLDPSHLSFAETIANWTLRHMQDRERGNFYYRKLKFYTNRISYMRWSNAWMLLALAELMTAQKLSTVNLKP